MTERGPPTDLHGLEVGEGRCQARAEPSIELGREPPRLVTHALVGVSEEGGKRLIRCVSGGSCAPN